MHLPKGQVPKWARKIPIWFWSLLKDSWQPIYCLAGLCDHAHVRGGTNLNFRKLGKACLEQREVVSTSPLLQRLQTP